MTNSTTTRWKIQTNLPAHSEMEEIPASVEADHYLSSEEIDALAHVEGIDTDHLESDSRA